MNAVDMRASAIAAQIKKITDIRPQIAFVLGSGWADVVSAVRNAVIVPYATLDGMPHCSVAGHAGNFVFGELASKPVMLVQGRIHLYEGKPIEEVVLPVAVASQMGANTIILTNAAGGISKKFAVGDLMLLRDHINATAQNPLIGVQPTEENPIFVDMTECYDVKLRTAIAEECAALGIGAAEGTYMQLLGPSYETPAEIAAYRALGADAVGMSTVVEAIYARYRKLRVAGLSCITNKAATAGGERITHAEVLAVLQSKRERFAALIQRIVARA